MAKVKLNVDHTPTPWKADGRYFETSSGKFYLAYGTDRYGNPLWRNFSELDENGRFIEHAVNLHDDLVNVLRRIIESATQADGGLNPDDIATARNLLAKCP